jgi:hypothetical protein
MREMSLDAAASDDDIHDSLPENGLGDHESEPPPIVRCRMTSKGAD